MSALVYAIGIWSMVEGRYFIGVLLIICAALG
jgi:hypothetical protein